MTKPACFQEVGDLHAVLVKCGIANTVMCMNIITREEFTQLGEDGDAHPSGRKGVVQNSHDKAVADAHLVGERPAEEWICHGYSKL
jgi:hypothetical protein